MTSLSTPPSDPHKVFLSKTVAEIPVNRCDHSDLYLTGDKATTATMRGSKKNKSDLCLKAEFCVSGYPEKVNRYGFIFNAVRQQTLT